MRRCAAFAISIILILGFIIIETDASAPYEDAEAFVVINAATENVVEGKDIFKRLPMASTTKIMTAIILCENIKDLSETIVTTKEMVTVEGSSMGLLEGDTVSYHDLLYGLLLASGNDAANTIAISVGGNIENFVLKMNEKAAELGLENTHFDTPSGLDGETHYTCAYDLARIAAYAIKIPEILKATSTKTAKLCYGNPPYNRSITNHNKLIGSYEGAIGVKTGFTKKSGRCLVSAVKRGEGTLIVVTLNAANDYENHKYLIERNFDKLIETDLPFPEEEVLVPSADGKPIKVSFPLIKSALLKEEAENISYQIYLPKFIYIPVMEGDKIGSIEYFVGEKSLCFADILSAESVSSSPMVDKKYIDEFKNTMLRMLRF